jgi:hypothetical protein
MLEVTVIQTVKGKSTMSSTGSEEERLPSIQPYLACTITQAQHGYLQVSGSKIWQMERSCMCCQESGEREANVSLFCPKAKAGERKFRKVS